MSASVREGQIVPALLRAAYPQDTAKRAAVAADVSHETSRNWVRGRSQPSLSILLRMASRCEQLAAALERTLAERHKRRDEGAASAERKP